MKGDLAALVAKLAHKGQKYGSEDYFEGHVQKVVDRCAAVKGTIPKEIAVAYLHDVVEDTELTLSDLSVFGFSDAIIDAVNALTRREGEDYFEEYLPRVFENGIAKFVKYHDICVNLEKCMSELRITNRANPLQLKKYITALQKYSIYEERM